MKLDFALKTFWDVWKKKGVNNTYIHTLQTFIHHTCINQTGVIAM